MKLALVLRELHRSESELAHTLLVVADRHRVDHEVFHVARDLARWSQDHVRQIAAIAERYGEHLDPDDGGEAGLLAALRDKGSEAVGRLRQPGLLLLRDLRDVYLQASGVSVDWEMLGQTAQAIQHTDLLEVAERCRPQTLRQARWANSKIKESSTQVLVT